MGQVHELQDHIAQNYREVVAERGITFDEFAEEHEEWGDPSIAAWSRAQAAMLRAQAIVDAEEPIEPKQRRAPKNDTV